MSTIGPQGIQAFITKWEVSGAAERANAQLFIAELCDVIGVEPPRPKTPDEHINAYVYEKTIPSVTDTHQLHRLLQARPLRTGNETGRGWRTGGS